MLQWIWKQATPQSGEPEVVLQPAPAPRQSPRSTPELSDDDLQDVVGGLERIYVEHSSA